MAAADATASGSIRIVRPAIAARPIWRAGYRSV
jgi:hypothetical protein